MKSGGTAEQKGGAEGAAVVCTARGRGLLTCSVSLSDFQSHLSERTQRCCRVRSMGPIMADHRELPMNSSGALSPGALWSKERPKGGTYEPKGPNESHLGDGDGSTRRNTNQV